VICGFGRTGEWFGCTRFNFRPDIMTLAKGITSGYLPLAAVMVGERVASVLTTMTDEFVHGYTYAGHPVACAVALENIRILDQENIVENVRSTTGPYLQARLAELADHPLVGEIRGSGLLAGIELVADRTTRRRFDAEVKIGSRCRDHCLESGLIMRAIRNIMVLSPPLVITPAQIDFIIETTRAALDKTADDLARSSSPL
jgi:putrescine aminotransferase